MGKIIEVMNGYMKEGKPFFSFEFFPPKTEDGVDNLFERMDRMVSYSPTFCDITWGAGGSTADLTLDIADRMQNEVNVECMMHLTCTNMPEEKLKEAMASLKKSGVRNILALRGDPPHGQDKFEAVDGGFACALDLIKYIRKETGAQALAASRFVLLTKHPPMRSINDRKPSSQMRLVACGKADQRPRKQQPGARFWPACVRHPSPARSPSLAPRLQVTTLALACQATRRRTRT